MIKILASSILITVIAAENDAKNMSKRFSCSVWTLVFL